MYLFLLAALTVKFLTKRFISEYDPNLGKKQPLPGLPAPGPHLDGPPGAPHGWAPHGWAPSSLVDLRGEEKDS